jgi:WD40 repeat protein
VKVWDAATGRKALLLTGHTGGVSSVVWSPDGQRLAAAGWDGKVGENGTVRVWDAVTGQEALTLKGHTTRVWSVAFSPDGKRLASASWGVLHEGRALPGEVKVWDAVTGQEVLTLQEHTGWVSSVAWNPDGSRLASAVSRRDNQQGPWHWEVKVWDAATGREVLTITATPFGSVGDAVFSPDGRRLAATDGGPVKVWDAATGQQVLSLKGGDRPLAFSPDGKRLACVSGDGVRVWDVATDQEVRTLKGHTGLVHSVAFSPDGQRLASANDDGTVKVWDAVTGQEVLTLQGHTNPGQRVVFSPDGQRLALVGQDGTVKVWDATSD